MKRIFILVTIIVVVVSCSQPKEPQQHFEGTMEFVNTFILKTNRFSLSYLDSVIGTKAFLYFKNGNYYEVYDKGFVLEELYRKDENKVYMRTDMSDTLKWISCDEEPKPIESYEINSKKETILGIECDEYIIRYKDKTTTFYFNKDTLSIDPEWFAKHTLANKNINSERMGAMYLKYKIEYPDFIVNITATQIDHRPLHDSIFTVKPGSILVKDPSAKK